MRAFALSICATYKGDDASSMRRLLFYFRIWVIGGARGPGANLGGHGPYPKEFGGLEKRTKREIDNLLLLAPPESKS